MRRAFAAWALAALLAAAPTFDAEAKTEVVIGELTWTGATAIQNVLKVVMEKYLDAEVSSIAAAEPALYEAMDRGDGSVDILPDVWSEHVPEQLNKYVVPGSRETVILNAKPYLGREGIYVPGYVQDQNGIKKVTDLADPEKAKLFDADGDGKGEWWAGAVGWEATNHSEVRAKSYGFDKYFTATTVEHPGFPPRPNAAITKNPQIRSY